MSTSLLPTTKAQVSGHRFLVRRVEHGLVLGDIRMLHDPLGARRRALLFGLTAVVLIGLGAADIRQLGPLSTQVLTDAEKATRHSLQYVDQSPDPAKLCSNCNLFLPGSGGCGGCTVMKGPIHPNGYCLSWVQKAG